MPSPTKKKTTKKSKGASHPPFAAMIAKALANLKGFQKMSRQQVAQFIKTNFGAENRAALNRALKAAVSAGKVTQMKGSYKLAPGAKKSPKKKSVKKTKKKKSPKKKTTKKKTAKKGKTSKAKATKKAVKKTVAKKKTSKRKSSPRKAKK